MNKKIYVKAIRNKNKAMLKIDNIKHKKLSQIWM